MKWLVCGALTGVAPQKNVPLKTGSDYSEAFHTVGEKNPAVSSFGGRVLTRIDYHCSEFEGAW